MSPSKALSSQNTIATKVLCWIALALSLGNPAYSEPKVVTKYVYYTVDSASLPGLRAQMKDRGPRGFWAYARWWVNWNRDCDVTVNITYTLPQHADPSVLSVREREKWDAMMLVMLAHEKQHGSHGISAGQEIVQANCKRPRRIIRKWAEQDRIYDRETEHGRLEGVTLR